MNAELIRRLMLIATDDVEKYGVGTGLSRWNDSDIDRECRAAAAALSTLSQERESKRQLEAMGFDAATPMLEMLRKQEAKLRAELSTVPPHAPRVLGELAGFASLCWEPKPTGVFDAGLASQGVARALDELYAAPQIPPTPACAHEWVSADNEKVSGCAICLKCKTIALASNVLPPTPDREK